MEKDENPSVLIQKAIGEKKNFVVIAGAGAGKTRALVQALIDVRILFGSAFRKNAQQVACITYTNLAVDVIRRRTEADNLFHVATIHGFLWSLINGFDDDLRRVLKDEIIPARIAKKRKDAVGASKSARTAIEQIKRLEDGLKNIDSVERIKYDVAGRRNYSGGKIDHDDVIDIAASLLSSSTVLQMIVSQKYPVILVDEAQDTFPNVMSALNALASRDGFPIVGYFGDPMQQIYENRTGNFQGPSGSEVIKIQQNHRCSKEVIKFLNKVRTDIEQVPGAHNLDGSVRIILAPTEVGRGLRKSYDDAQLADVRGKFETALTRIEWSADTSDDTTVKSLFLTRQMIAQRLGFADLNKLFTGDFSSRASEDEFKDGTHFLIQPFVETLIPVVEATRKLDGENVTQTLVKTSPMLRPDGVNSREPFGSVVAQLQTALSKLVDIWDVATTREILALAQSLKLVELGDRLNEHLSRQPRTEQYDEMTYGAEREDWLVDEFLKFKVKEVVTYREFVLNHTTYSTQHGVKGDEFKRVLVVFDDTEASWSHYSFSRVFTPKTAGAQPTEGQAHKTRNLAYVCFSRAICDLRIILFTVDAFKAKEELKELSLFRDDQIEILH
ncbi:DNA helicase-2 / ATP-dependent DNA helicase PcrA [Massilia sp. PDC64]|nr:UvrD-helicase domain-containing protein [Massilia sp. PDC64]SDC26577.1 DNA helicase-2 / ATP-dependent DNA helicase PcrA [Massilia sp. PDC64]